MGQGKRERVRTNGTGKERMGGKKEGSRLEREGRKGEEMDEVRRKEEEGDRGKEEEKVKERRGGMWEKQREIERMDR